MSGEYNGLCRERKQLAFDAAHESEFVTAVEVATTAAPCKNDVAREKERWHIVLSVDLARILAEEGESARGVSRHVNHLQFDFCDFDDVAFV